MVTCGLVILSVACQWVFPAATGEYVPQNSVSYFGGSYQYLPAEVISNSSPDYVNGSSRRTSVELWFKTARTDALLFMANGTKSLCSLRLKGGRLEVEFQIEGSEKLQFLSPLSLGQFHDSVWHKVVVQRLGDEFSLSLDDKNLTFRSQQIPPDSVFLLDDGLHIGGVPLGTPISVRTSFRGCLADIRFNGRDVISAINATSHPRRVSVDTRSACARQFDHDSADFPLQFIESPSQTQPYLLFELNNSEETLNYLHFELRTVSTTAPLFSTMVESIPRSKSSFCIGVVDGSLHLITFDHGRRIHRSRIKINNGRWRSVDVHFSTDRCELIIDNITESIFMGSSIVPNLGKSIQFGSLGHCIEDADDQEALRVNPFQGCLHNIVLNYKHYTLRNVTASHRLDVGCDDVCSGSATSGHQSSDQDRERLSDKPDQKRTLSDQNVDTSPDLSDQKAGRLTDRVFCDQPASLTLFPEPSSFPAYSRVSVQKQSLIDQAIRVSEGGSVRLEPRHFYFLPASIRASIPNRNIVFHVNQKPGHGKLTLLEHAVSTFTYQDVIDGKINYTHDGLEQHEDSVELELEMRGIADGAFTAGLNVASPATGSWHGQNIGDHRYTLPVAIVPVNDPPVIEFPSGPVLRIAQNSRLRITDQEIVVIDSDHDPADVKIKVVFATPNCGFFEHVRRPGLPATEFTQEDLLNYYINYFHFGLMNGQTTLVASDPWEEGKPVTLNVHAFPVDFRQITNEGLNHNGQSLITSSHLEYSSNARNQSIDIVYRITRPPKHGRVEYEDDIGHWYQTRSFNQSQIDDGKIRYTSNSDEDDAHRSQPQLDSFAFTLSTLNASSPNEYEFEIRFVRTIISVFNPTPFILNNTLKLYLSRTYLFANTAPRVAFTEDIVYRLVRPPMYGLLYLVIDEATSRNRVLGVSSNFTQADIDQERVFYQLRYVHYTVVNDYFLFKTSALGSTTGEKRYDITYLPGEDDFKLINKTLMVQEGSLQRVTNSTLHLETKDSVDFNFTIYLPPKHGSFTLMALSQMRQLRANDAFTSADIKDSKLFYRHDDSETQSDSAYLIARPIAPSRGFAPQVPFWYSIKVILVNDNPPKRYDSEHAQNPVFHVVRQGERLVTNQDLCFIDADTDFDQLQLRYSFPNRPVHGGFFYAKKPDVPLHEFTQEDVNSGSVLLRHFGPDDIFSWPFSVTDGKHHTPGQFVVNASAPFLKERRNTGLKVQRGSMSILSPYNLTVETNLNVAINNIVYKVISAPRYGKLLSVDPKAEEGSQVTTFTQRDIDHFRIIYAHNNATTVVSKKDQIAATVFAGTLEETVKIEISIFDADDSLLRIVHLRQLRVDRGGIAVINSATLKAEHAFFTPKQVTFLVKKHPSAGTIVLDAGTGFNGTSLHTGFSSAERFTQADVNEGRVHYVHRWMNAEAASIGDEIIFDIIAPNLALNGVVLRVGIVEREITLVTRNFTVDKGGKRIIRSQHLQVKSSFGSTMDDHSTAYEFIVLKQPKHGMLQMRRDEEQEEDDEDNYEESGHDGSESLGKFKYKDVMDRKIQYAHDGSKTWKDEFTVFAKLVNDGQLQSKQKTMYIRIKHVNEKEPEIVRNEPLELHTRREAAISVEHLYAVDSDTPPDEIVFRVTSPTGGHVAFAGNLSRPIVEFKQRDIDEGRVFFVHSAGTDGGFYFSVSDGLHQLPARQFAVHAMELSFSLATNQRLTVSPGATEVITAEYLKAVVGNVEPSRILFTVTKSPRSGTLVRGGSTANPLTFNQQDVNQNQIAYKQTKPMKKWEARDFFSFIVSLNETETGERLLPLEEDSKFRIFITYGAMDHQQASKYIRTSTLKVLESEKASINTTHMNVSLLSAAVPESAPLIFELIAPPDYGFLRLRSHNLSQGSQFVPQDLLNSWVLYNHVARSSSPNHDRMQFDVFPTGESRYPLRLRLDVDIMPSPARRRNLQPKYLTPSLKVVQGTRRQITTRDLSITTTYLPLSSIVYRIAKPSENGYFAYASSTTKSIMEFSQEDINENRLDFIHNVSTGVQNGSAAFFISLRIPPDEQIASAIPIPNLNHTVQIIVENLTLSCPNFHELTYRQGAQYVVVTNNHLSASSNGPPTGIYFNVTQPPRNGALYWLLDGKRKPATLFTQADVNAHRIFYAPLKMNSSADSFAVTVSNAFNEIPGKVVQIHVVPAVERNDMRVEANGTFLINEDVLKVGPEIADRDPRFLIIRQPAFGLLVRDDQYRNLSRRGNWTPALEPVSEFTAKDIAAKKIRYVNSMPVKHHVLDERLLFEVRATGVQPARGHIVIYVVPGGGPVPTVEPQVPIWPLAPTAVAAGESGIATGEGSSHQPTRTAYPDIIRDHNIVIFVLVPVVFLALMFIVVRRVRVGKERERRQLKEKLLAQQRQQQSTDSSRPDLLDATLYSLGSSPPTQGTDLSSSTSGIARDPYRTYERTASIKSGLSSKLNIGTLHRNGGNTLPARALSLEKASKGMLTTGASTTPTTPTSHSGYQTFFAPESPPPAAARMVTFDPGRTEIISSVPMCKVTPLMPKPAASTCSSSSGDDFRYAYQYSSSASEPEFKSDRTATDRAGSYRQQYQQRKGPRSPIKQMKLKENQYWV